MKLAEDRFYISHDWEGQDEIRDKIQTLLEHVRNKVLSLKDPPSPFSLPTVPTVCDWLVVNWTRRLLPSEGVESQCEREQWEVCSFSSTEQSGTVYVLHLPHVREWVSTVFIMYFSWFTSTCPCMADYILCYFWLLSNLQDHTNKKVGFHGRELQSPDFPMQESSWIKPVYVNTEPEPWACPGQRLKTREAFQAQSHKHNDLLVNFTYEQCKDTSLVHVTSVLRSHRLLAKTP